MSQDFNTWEELAMGMLENIPWGALHWEQSVKPYYEAQAEALRKAEGNHE